MFNFQSYSIRKICADRTDYMSKYNTIDFGCAVRLAESSLYLNEGLCVCMGVRAHAHTHITSYTYFHSLRRAEKTVANKRKPDLV